MFSSENKFYDKKGTSLTKNYCIRSTLTVFLKFLKFSFIAFEHITSVEYCFIKLHMNLWLTDFYSGTFVYSRFSPKIEFLYCLLSSVAPWGGCMVDNEGEIFEIYMCRSLENAFFLDFPWNFRVLWGVLKKS